MFVAVALNAFIPRCLSFLAIGVLICLFNHISGKQQQQQQQQQPPSSSPMNMHANKISLYNAIYIHKYLYTYMYI